MGLDIGHYQIEFRPTEEHADADGLSCRPIRGTVAENADTDPRIFNVSQLKSLSVNVRQL